MKLFKLLDGIDYELLCGSVNIDIKDISYDSRSTKKDEVFVALIGIDNDGHNFINDAISKGSNCIIICKDICINYNKEVTVIKIDDTRKQLSILSSNFFDNPQEKLIKIGITGTKGKTSTSWMIKKILEENGDMVGVIGTVGTYINGKLYKHKNTTPESYQVQKFMRIMIDEGVKYLIMEASSTALKTGRINNIIFEYGIFTNLSIDHVGPREHPSYDDYVYSKSKLFKQCKVGIFNCDDIEYFNMINDSNCKIYTFGTNKKCSVNISNISCINNTDFLGTSFSLNGLIIDQYKVSSPGSFSAYNACGAIIVCNLLGVSDNTIKKGLEHFSVDGRCEIMNINNKYKVVIDFAHNKLSMESIINTMKMYKYNRIITVFGCCGGRSSEIRYDLGELSGRLSDLSIITTDDPRNDDILEIINDIEKGVMASNGDYIIIERKEAILYALRNACDNDIILLLGKGHEKFQEIKGVLYPFDEKQIIYDFLNESC